MPLDRISYVDPVRATLTTENYDTFWRKINACLEGETPVDSSYDNGNNPIDVLD